MNTLPDRRTALALVAAGLLVRPVAASPRPDADLRDALDRLDTLPDASARLAALARFDPRDLGGPARLDLQTVRAGLRIDRRLELLPAVSPARYALQVSRACGTGTDVVRAERRLRAERDRLVAAARPLFRALGQPDEPTGAAFRRLFTDPSRRFTDDDAGRDVAVATMNRWLDAARAALPRWFDSLPRHCLDVAVRRMTATELASGKGGFRELPAPGKSGSYTVDLRDIVRRPVWTLRSVVHHELLPGHMVQLPLQARADPQPLRLRYAPGFVEGWAIHAEILAWREGLVRDPAEQLGVIHWLLFRIQRALADVRLHHFGWSPSALVEAILGDLGFPAYFADPATDVAQIARQPGLRLAEALTALTLSDRARTAPCLRGFHTRVLAAGPVPLPLLPAA